MTLQEIAVKNLLRRKAKAAFILAGLVAGIATVVAVVTFSEAMTGDINDKLEKYGANILVVPRTDSLSLTYGGVSMGGVSLDAEEINQSDLKGIDNIENAASIAAVGPMALGAVEINGHRILLAGVDLSAARFLRPWWKLDGAIPGDDGIILGSEAARILATEKEKQLLIGGRELRVAGILEPTGSQDDGLVFSSLVTAQTILGKEGKVSMVEVAALCNACPVEEMVRQISEALPGTSVMAIQQVVKGRMETLGKFRRFSYGICAMVLLVGSLVVLVTMMGSVRERTEEIGIFRAIGFRKSHIMKIIFIEAGILSLIAGIAGYAAGLLGTFMGFALFTDSEAASLPINPQLMAVSILLALVLGVLASAYPALLASRMDPNDALRAL